jgi:DNA-binding LacI/PurR family transcriptional regulator
MSSWRVLSASEQVAAQLRAELATGRWRGTIPGVYQLATELAVSRSTVETALRDLEASGVLMNLGPGKRRSIEPSGCLDAPTLRIAILRFETADPGLDYMIEIQHLLTKAGHTIFYPAKTLQDLGMDVKRVARFVKKTEADAWVVVAGSREVLEWFAAQPAPAFALFGRRQSVDIASIGPDTTPTIATVTRRLVELGHQRIVMLSRRHRQLPKPAQFERTFLAELKAHGLAVGPYNLPDWEGTREGLHRLLESLFQLTPLTALIVHEVPQFTAVLRYIAGRGIQTPKDISLVCTDPGRSFSWCEPPVSHIAWDLNKIARRVARWAANVHSSKEDRRRTDIEAQFVEHGTIGPAKEG